MENIWFYFFSALMQTAASLMAIFGVFAVFKIDKINNKINQIKELIIKVFVSLKNNENTPSAENKENKEFCNKYSINTDKNTFEKYRDKDVLKMFHEYWYNKGNFIADRQFGNDLITEESLILFRLLLNNKNVIINQLLANSALLASLIILASIFLATPSNYRVISYVYIMVVYTTIVILYNLYSTVVIIKK